MHSTLHDWPDDVCEEIIANIKAAMKPGYSKLLINENVIPDTRAWWEMSALDIMMLTLFCSKERSRVDWTHLIEQRCGMKIVNIWEAGKGTESLIDRLRNRSSDRYRSTGVAARSISYRSSPQSIDLIVDRDIFVLVLGRMRKWLNEMNVRACKNSPASHTAAARSHTQLCNEIRREEKGPHIRTNLSSLAFLKVILLALRCLIRPSR